MLGHRTIVSARSERVEHSGCWERRVDTVEAHADDARPALLAHEPFLHRELLGCSVELDRDARRDTIVTHRDEGARDAPGARDLVRNGRQRRAGAQPGCSVQMGCEIAVTEAEPGRQSVARGRVHRGEGLAREAPARLGVGCAGERVGDGVEIGTHAQSEEVVVVTGVDDDGQLARIGDLHEAAEKARCPDSACERREHQCSVTNRGEWSGSRSTSTCAPSDGDATHAAKYARPPVSGPDDVTDAHARAPGVPEDAEAPAPEAAPEVGSDAEPEEQPVPALEDVPAEPDAANDEPPEALLEDMPDEQVGDDADDQGVPAPPQYPPVVAVLITRNAGPWLEATLESLGAQDYPDLVVLVVDAGSDEDPSARIAAVLPRAYVRRSDGGGFGAAANAAIDGVEGAPLLLFCHDDITLDPGAVRVLVEEAYRSNAGIVGPKLVDANDPEVLLEVGRSIDRFGGYHTGIEPGELDQEQHDGVRDVFYVSSAAMLVRSDLFAELGGFDPSTFPGAEDLDLCWRARLLGARVIVAPDARAGHRQAAAERVLPERHDHAAEARSRVRVLLTCYTIPTLIWLVPAGVVFALLEGSALVVTGRRRRARAIIGAWFTNFGHPGEIRRARSRAQANRRIRDQELREYQVGAVHRMREFFTHHLHGDERVRHVGTAGRTAFDRVAAAVRSRATLAFAVFLAVYLFGSRHLIGHGVPAFGAVPGWPSIGTTLRSYTSAWRYTGLGSDAAAPPAQLLMSALGMVFLGSMNTARTALLVGAIPLGGVGAYRLLRRFSGGAGAAAAGALAYAANPTPRNALAHGRLGPLVFFALFPFLIGAIVRVAALPRGR